LKKLFCSARKEWVAATPEELVRQRLLHHLIHDLLFPREGIALEKALSSMPHLSLSKEKMPDRRFDMACYAKGIHPEHSLYPLLIIECKAVKLTDVMMHQLIGYNYYAKAKFLTLVNQDEIRFQFYDSSLSSYKIVSFIPSYQQLLSFTNTNSIK